MAARDFLDAVRPIYDEGRQLDILQQYLDDTRADLSEAEDRYLAAEHDLELLQTVVWKVTTGPLAQDPHGFTEGWFWPLGDGDWSQEVTEDEADAINRALDACS